ncbi:glycosyltransferase [Psychrobacter urativorans]|uniref:glycosyltransferase n=1 Tax=Psychrobacter urativorans TaxID=45610 RepID=UPI001919ECB2|nr:glycosyltransferase [Psychrobacter urativorans]
MKILYVITGLAQGGAERVVCDMADNIFEKNNEVKIVYLTGDILTRPINKEIELIDLNLNGPNDLLKAYLNLSRIIRNYKPDVVHSHMVHANLLARLIRMITPIDKLISTAHNSNEGGRARMLLYRLTHKLADVTTNVSNTAVESFKIKNAVPKDGMITVYNGVNFNKFNYNSKARQYLLHELNISEKHKIILSVGRFNKQKNYFNLLKSIKYLREYSSIPFTLLIAGDGELRNKIEETITELELDASVILLGRRNDIPKLMSACDVFVLSSDYEGLPTVLIEALACQANVVSTDVSGAREIIENYGEIVPIKDAKNLALAIEKALDIKEKNILGYNYAKSKFNLDIISEKWISIYNE